MKKSFKNRAIILLALLLVLSAFIVFLLFWNGIILLNNPSYEKYPVRGVDVSHYQGDIDWDTLSSQNISFAFIKATEGSSYIDDKYAYNSENARKSGLAVGAYHFFSYDSPGITQAENFINTVEPFEGMLPPVIDLEFYGDKEKHPPDREDVSAQLNALLEALEKHYRLTPIIYVTEKSYELYISGEYEQYDIWIRNVISKPKLSDNRVWTFWQFTDRARLDGYSGEEKYIDLNVFIGGKDEFYSYPKYGIPDSEN